MSVSMGTPRTDQNRRVRIGSFGGDNARCMIDNVRVFTRLLDADEIFFAANQ
jgi:hypothetical protein